MKPVLDRKYPYLLCTFASPNFLKPVTYVPDYFILDSGAFTAWQTGRQVDIESLGNFATALRDRWKNAKVVNLDVIPGSPGRTSSEADRRLAQRKSLENADYLRSRGLPVMEVFHQDESAEFLRLLLERRQEGEVLGISPRNDLSIAQRAEWLHRVTALIIKETGKDNFPPCHGLAVTSPKMLKAFPFYSADSTTYSNPRLYGHFINEKGQHRNISTLLGDPTGQSSKSKHLQNLAIRYQADYYLRLGEQITLLWEKRGITIKENP